MNETWGEAWGRAEARLSGSKRIEMKLDALLAANYLARSLYRASLLDRRAHHDAETPVEVPGPG